jgi:hypothetical protein
MEDPMADTKNRELRVVRRSARQSHGRTIGERPLVLSVARAMPWIGVVLLAAPAANAALTVTPYCAAKGITTGSTPYISGMPQVNGGGPLGLTFCTQPGGASTQVLIADEKNDTLYTAPDPNNVNASVTATPLLALATGTEPTGLATELLAIDGKPHTFLTELVRSKSSKSDAMVPRWGTP